MAKKLLPQKYRHKQNLSKVKNNVWVKLIKSKMTYSESPSDFSFAINLVSDFHSASKSDPNSGSEYDFSSEFINLDICMFSILYLHFSK